MSVRRLCIIAASLLAVWGADLRVSEAASGDAEDGDAADAGIDVDADAAPTPYFHAGGGGCAVSARQRPRRAAISFAISP